MNSSKYATNNHNPTNGPSPTYRTENHHNPNSTANNASSKVFEDSVALADLGSARFNHDTAEITDRDSSLFSHQPTTLRKGRAPKGLENQAFAWSTFQYTTEERDEREEQKGDLHDGALWRMNRMARGEGDGVQDDGGFGEGRGRGGRVRGGRWGKRGGGEVGNDDGRGDALCAGRKMGGNVPPLAKGMAEEMDKSLFWDGPIG